MKQIYQEIFAEDIPFETPPWETLPVPTSSLNEVKTDPRLSMDFPEGYPVGNPAPLASPNTPVQSHSRSSSNKRTKKTPPTEASNQRQFRCQKHKSVETTHSLRVQTETNPYAIQAQSYEAILRPYGKARDTDLLSLWSFQTQQDFACQLTAVINGASFSGTILLPKININIIPAAIANVLCPTGSQRPTATYHLDTFTCRVSSQIPLKTVIGQAEAQLSYYISADVQVPVLGSNGMQVLQLFFDPRLWCITSSHNDIIKCGRIPLKSNAAP